MAQTLVNIRMDSELKADMDKVCHELGLNMTTAFTMFAKKMTREKRIPFEVSVDPLYSEDNIKHFLKAIEELNAGKGVEHELLEDEW